MEIAIALAFGALLLLGMALAASAASGRRMGGDAEALFVLSRERSPSGRRFFPNLDEVWELSGELDDAGATSELLTRRRREGS